MHADKWRVRRALQFSTLSVWYIEDDKSNLEQVAVAVASTRDSFSPFDYALVDETLLTAINIYGGTFTSPGDL